MRFSFSLALVAALLLAACSSSQDPPPQDVIRVDPGDAEVPELGASEGPEPEDIVSGVGVVTYVDLEGGFYGIVVGDSTRYNPLNLDAAFQEDGLRVRFRGVLQTDVMTTQMWGTPLEILEITRTLGQ